ncbi:MAG: hypothetical protein JXB30_02475 [Anaerolineae bacterium]|nr:hypothetical protein [Anaerolineae bacterium]
MNHSSSDHTVPKRSQHTDPHRKLILFVVIFSLIVQSVYIYRVIDGDFFLPDDAYYYLSLARNVSEGNGPKVDSFNNTTGFQPLWGAICICAFMLIHNDAMAVLSLLLVSLLAELVTVWLLYRWMSDLALPATAIVLMTCWWTLSSQTMLNMLNGMETNLSILFVMAVYYSLKSKNAWITGLLCGMAVLARIDALVLVISITLVWLYQRQLKNILVLWLSIFLVALPWMIFASSIGKPLIPESGQAVRLLTLSAKGLPYHPVSVSIWRNPAFHWRQLVSFVNFLGWNTIALYPFSLFPDLSAVLVCLSIILVMIRLRNVHTVAIFLLHIVGLIAAYSLFVGGYWFHFRYTASIGLLFSALLVGIFYQRVSQKLLTRIYAIFVSAGVIVLHILFNPLLNTHSMGLSLTSGGQGFYDSTIWMNQNIPSTSIVGAFQTGIVSYYSDFSVLNLDGKVNDDAYVALRDNTMWQYLCQSEVDYVVDWPSFIDELLIRRSSHWEDDNLTQIKQMAEVSIYKVNRANCSAADK